MTTLLTLPKDVILEIMLNLDNESDYFALLSTCKQIFGLKSALKKLQEDKKVMITSGYLCESEFARALLLHKNDVIASCYFGPKSPTDMTLDYEMRVNVSNFHKIQNMCKIAGNHIIFRKKINDEEGMTVYLDNRYIKVIFSWISNKIAAIKINDGTKILRYKFGKKWKYQNVNLVGFYSLYYEFYKGTMFEEFPGKILFDALELIGGLPES